MMRALLIFLMTSTAALAETSPVTAAEAYAMARATILEFDAPVGGILAHIAPEKTWAWAPQDPTIPGDPQSLTRFQAVDQAASLGILNSDRRVECQRLGPLGHEAIKAARKDNRAPDAAYLDLQELADPVRAAKAGPAQAMTFCTLRFPLAESPDPLAELQAAAAGDFTKLRTLPDAGAMLLTGGKAKPDGLIGMLNITLARTIEGQLLIEVIGGGIEPPPS